MLDGYNRTTNMVLEVLKDPRIQLLNFSVSLYRFRPHDYARLAIEILRGNVDAEFDRNQTSTAAYNPQEDTLYFGFKTLKYIEHKAAIVHECTHAICDMRGLKLMDQTASEMAAYIAQYMFLAAYIPKSKRAEQQFNLGAEDNIGYIGRAAWRIAHSYLCQNDPHKKELAPGFGTDADYADLADAIRKSNLYKKKADNMVGNNGV